MINVKIKLLNKDCMPVYKSSGAACADCFANIDQDIVIPPKSNVGIPLGFALEMEEGYQAVIRPRSGLARKKRFVAIDGEIDWDFRGEVSATLENFSDKPFTVCKGARICQIKFLPYHQAVFTEVSSLSDTERGEAGFGSTGV